MNNKIHRFFYSPQQHPWSSQELYQELVESRLLSLFGRMTLFLVYILEKLGPPCPILTLSQV